MRGVTTFLIAAVVVALVATVAATSPGSADDDYEQRISDLETRVAALEAAVGIATPTPQPTPTEEPATGGSSSSSSASSQSSGSGSFNSYSASYSANGSREYELEIKNAGTYLLTVHLATSPVTVQIEDPQGAIVPDFSLQVDDGGSSSASGRLEAGTYTLRVEASSQWALILVSSGD